MALDPNRLVRYANLKKDDRDAMFDLAKRHEGLVRIEEGDLDETLAQVAQDRTAFAERRAALATALVANPLVDEETSHRDAIVAAYDACHHALRALHVGFEGWDPIEHQVTLDSATKLLDGNEDLAKRFEWMNLGRPVPDVVNDLRAVRQAAEWDVYNLDEAGKTRVDFAANAASAAKLAEGTTRTVRLALGDRRSGVLAPEEA